MSAAILGASCISFAAGTTSAGEVAACQVEMGWISFDAGIEYNQTKLTCTDLSTTCWSMKPSNINMFILYILMCDFKLSFVLKKTNRRVLPGIKNKHMVYIWCLFDGFPNGLRRRNCCCQHWQTWPFFGDHLEDLGHGLLLSQKQSSLGHHL